jgi:hypothetical protein
MARDLTLPAFCGIVCAGCPAYVATRANDENALAALAAQWGSADDVLTANDVRCDGCPPGGERLYKHCAICPVRPCALEHGVATCAHCSLYACDRLKRLWRMVGTDKPRHVLDDVRREML